VATTYTPRDFIPPGYIKDIGNPRLMIQKNMAKNFHHRKKGIRWTKPQPFGECSMKNSNTLA
jgi:hypothetical protein